MEYVKNAIERARKERGEHIRGRVNGSRSVQSSLPRNTPIDHAAEPVDEAVRCVPVDKERLLKHRVVAAFEHDERAEPYRQLRTQILRKFREKGWRTLAITSAHTDAGKSLTAVNTAIALAMDVNQTVVLVDLDFKGPDVLQIFGLSAEAGLVEYLHGEVEMKDIMINPGLERLTIIPSMPVSGVTSEILSSPEMKRTMDEIVNRYSDRIIVFDLPPLLRDDDALVFAPYADTTVLLVENGVTTPADLERCVQLLEGTHILGTIFNKAD